MQPRFWDMVKAAFNARPIGMPLPPNWIALAAVGLVGVIQPGALLIGAGLEIAYLAWLAHEPRFRRVVAARGQVVEEQAWAERLERQIAALAEDDLDRYRHLEGRCRAIVAQQAKLTGDAAAANAQNEGLSRLLWIYLRLLGTRRAVSAIDDDDRGGKDSERARLFTKVETLEKQLAAPGIDEGLRQSLSGQLDIVRERVKKRDEAVQKLAFVDAELGRIEQQVELIREQSALAGDATGVSRRIDDVAATLGGTSDWITEQQRLFGQVEELVVGTPPLLTPQAAPPPARNRSREKTGA